MPERLASVAKLTVERSQGYGALQADTYETMAQKLTVRGPWPKKKYAALVDAHGNLLSALALLGSAYARLQPAWCRRLERSDHLHPAFVSHLLDAVSRK